MCIIIGKQAGSKFPKDEYLKNSESYNGDGIGIAYHKVGTNKVIIKKDFKNVETLIQFQKENLTEADAVLYHFRFATHGLKDEGNRHPFPASKDENLLRATNLETTLAIAHNGVLSEYSDKNNKLSDTQLFISDIMSDQIIIDNINNDIILKLLAGQLHPSRLAILQNNGELIYLNDFKEEDGCMYSNQNYKTAKFNYTTDYYASAKSWYSEYGYTAMNRALPHKQLSPALKTAYKDRCDGCGDVTYIMDVEYEDIILHLCKKCRKKHRKNELHLKDNFATQEQEQEMYYCSSCQTYHPKKKIYSITQGVYACEACFTSLSLE